MLLFVSVCEGFDIALTSVVLPYTGSAFHADTATLGRALSIVGSGSIAAWALIRLADRFGRRPLLILSSCGFSICSLLTILAPTMAIYTGVQTIARMLMVTQVAVAYIILSESLPPHLRGRANGVLGSSGAIGAALPFLMLGRALASPLGWKALFLIGAAPLLALPAMALWLRETNVWRATRTAGVPRPGVIGELRELVGPALRNRFAAMSALWFIVNFASGASSLFFTLYVVQERHWAASDLILLSPAMMTSAFVGYLLAGLIMDLVGRRAAMSLFLLAIGGLTQLCYLSTTWWAIAGCWVGIQATLGIWTAGFTINAELFPTHLRAASNGWCNSLIGRWGMVLAPVALATMTHRLGAIAPAATWLGAIAYLGLPLIWLALPETRGRAFAPAA
jgi:MFS family permease